MYFSGKTYYFTLRIDHFWEKIFQKCNGAIMRLADVFLLFPVRFARLIQHLGRGLRFLLPQHLKHWWQTELQAQLFRRIMKWWMLLPFYLMDVLGLPEWYETFMDFFKFNSRGLYDWEIEMARPIFGDSINYDRVRIDEYAFAGPKQHRFCYVSFHTINSWTPMLNQTLLHELVHVWQFQKMGSVYIPRALAAQHSNLGYNYGGVSTLRSYLQRGKTFLDFNLEQQGDIISDYYRIRSGYAPCWGRGDRLDLPVYEAFLQQMREVVVV